MAGNKSRGMVAYSVLAETDAYHSAHGSTIVEHFWCSTSGFSHTTEYRQGWQGRRVSVLDHFKEKRVTVCSGMVVPGLRTCCHVTLLFNGALFA